MLKPQGLRMTPNSSAHCLSASALFAAMLVVATTSARASVEIDTKPTHNMNCSGGVCSPTDKNADLNATDLANMLATADVKVTTGSGAVTITVSAPFSWTSTHRLTLDAYYNVSFRAPVEVAGTGAVTIVTNDGGSGGQVTFFPGGKIDFWDLRSSVVINRKSYKLVADIKSLAAAIASHSDKKKDFALAADYDASLDGTYHASPIPTALNGEVTGLGHAVKNLTVQITAYAQELGFFAVVGSSGGVRDLTLEDPVLTSTIRGSIPFTGFLAGSNSGRIVDAHIVGGQLGVRGRVRAFNCAGAIAGLSTGTIASSDVLDTTINTANYSTPGGIVCQNYGTLSGLFSNAVVSAGRSSWAGGLASINYGAISLSSTGGTVSVAPNKHGADLNEGAGGLVGTNYGTIDQSFSTAIVYGGLDQGSEDANSAYGGGLVGVNIGVLSNSYFRGKASILHGDGYGSYLGGLIGEEMQSSQSQTSFSTGALSGDGCIGGDVGIDEQSSNAAIYWDLNTSGVGETQNGACNPQNDPGITGLTNAELKGGLPAGFDPAIWAQSPSINKGYPYLIANPPQ